MYLFSADAGIFTVFMFIHFLWKGLAIPIPITEANNSNYKIHGEVLNGGENVPTYQDNTQIENVKDCINTTTDLNALSQKQFLNLLTSDCRYDRLTKPYTTPEYPLKVSVRLDIRHIELLDQQQFKMETLIQYRYIDNRLNYEKLSPKRDFMLGREMVKSRIWIPHVVIAHEKDAKVTGLEGKDVFVTISPQGEVFYAYRTSILIYCWMDFRKFPFDKQVCRMTFQSWMHNASSMVLRWEEDQPVKFSSQMHLTGFVLEGFWTTDSFIEPPIVTGLFGGNYSSLECKFKVAREIGFYLLDYFIPSIILVCTSWVTFWLQADNGAPRTTLGTATMLSFITLASGQTKPLPKVSYIKISEIWFLGCSIFIFASMVEFAFVNIIWRRRKAVELKKHGTIKSICLDDGISTRRTSISESDVTVDDCQSNGWTTMTPHEVANWIDKRSRVAFPIAFLIFNVFFWTSALSVAHES